MCVLTHAIDELHRWQDLVGAALGAVALILTVRWTLLSERRRQSAEADALRVALGAEVRQFANGTLRALQDIIAVLSASGAQKGLTTVTRVWLADCARFVDPVIYPQTAGSLGLLRDHAYAIAFFFNKVAMVRDGIRRLSENYTATEPLPRAQILAAAESLLRTAESAVQAMLAFINTPRSDYDLGFADAVSKAHIALAQLKTSA